LFKAILIETFLLFIKYRLNKMRLYKKGANIFSEGSIPIIIGIFIFFVFMAIVAGLLIARLRTGAP